MYCEASTPLIFQVSLQDRAKRIEITQKRYWQFSCPMCVIRLYVLKKCKIIDSYLYPVVISVVVCDL